MIAGLFLNPGFLFIAAALVSVPIIIHLINRMRFKRIRWAAMEFLLKAQKRTRRRLIIEQLILLALRCLLIALVGFLVSRFIGCGDSGAVGKPNIHIALLDDTLSMQDAEKIKDGEKTCFDVAKNDILLDKIAKAVGSKKTNDVLMVMLLSKVDEPGYEPMVFDHLNDPSKKKELETYLSDLQPSMLHVKMIQGLKAAKRELDKYAESQATLHVLTDLRQPDWSQNAGGQALAKELASIAKDTKDVKVRLIDCVMPARGGNQSAPESRNNVGIVDFRPSTRVVGHKMVVKFTVTVKNFSGEQVEAFVRVRDENKALDDPTRELRDVDFNPPAAPIKLAPLSETVVEFERGDLRHGGYFFNDDFIPGESRYAHLSVRLTNAQLGPLDGDGLLPDNIRHAVVEVRDKVPILIIDGMGGEGRKDAKDSFHFGRALISVPGGSYVMEYGDELAKGNSVNALDRADLSKYPCIYLLNVRQLSPKQLTNLENFVRDGGGLGIYLGPEVDLKYYNDSLYKAGNGLMPAPLREMFPAKEAKEIPTRPSDTYQLLTREDKMPPGRTKLPIFGNIIEEQKHRELLKSLPIHRYFKVDRSRWKQERVSELATLPNDEDASNYDNDTAAIVNLTNDKAVAMKRIMDDKKYSKYHKQLVEHIRKIREKAQAGTEFKAYQLAAQIEELLNDKGSTDPKDGLADLTEFWGQSDDDVQSVAKELRSLRDMVNYGDPFVIMQSFGKGKVVAIMSTAGKDWNEWPAGPPGSILYEPFVREMQEELASPGSDANLTVGTNLNLSLNGDAFKGKRLKLVRTMVIPKAKKDDKDDPSKKLDEETRQVEGTQIVFNLTGHHRPGLYLSELFDAKAAEDNKNAKPIARYAHTFNVDTANEGQLQRVGTEELQKEFIDPSGDNVAFYNPGMPDTKLVAKATDLSESPWLFLILLLVLVAEQALAVHLSFHLRNTDNEMLPAGAGR